MHNSAKLKTRKYSVCINPTLTFSMSSINAQTRIDYVHIIYIFIRSLTRKKYVIMRYMSLRVV